jgi:hypothetical protein
LQGGGQGGRGNVVPGTNIGIANRNVVDRRVIVFKCVCQYVFSMQVHVHVFKYSKDQNQKRLY